MSKLYDVEVGGIRFPVKGEGALDVLDRLVKYQGRGESWECKQLRSGEFEATATCMNPPVTIRITKAKRASDT